jgi:hypothetical protein
VSTNEIVKYINTLPSKNELNSEKRHEILKYFCKVIFERANDKNDHEAQKILGTLLCFNQNSMEMSSKTTMKLCEDEYE